MKKYLLLISVLAVSAPALAVEGDADLSSEQPAWHYFAKGIIWPFKPFEVVGTWEEAFRKDSSVNKILREKYWPACPPLRFTFRFLHCTPTTYIASSLYYCALATGGVKGYQKIKKWLQRNSTSPKTSKNRKDKKLKRAAWHHHDCPWCMAHQENGKQAHIAEGSL